MARFVATAISDVLIIRACNTETGSGGVARWLSGVASRTKKLAEARAPVSDPLDRLHRPWDEGGTYKASFEVLPKVGNQHVIQRYVTNMAPHAVFVERGRSASSKQQFYSSRRWPVPHWSGHTGAREGQNILGDSLADVLRTSRAYHAHGTLRRF